MAARELKIKRSGKKSRRLESFSRILRFGVIRKVQTLIGFTAASATVESQ